MNKTTHTPTPWKVTLGRGKNPRLHIQTTAGYQIASTPELDSLHKPENDGRLADAELIIKAVNSHDRLVEALGAILAEFADYEETYNGGEPYAPFVTARALLAELEGGA